VVRPEAWDHAGSEKMQLRNATLRYATMGFEVVAPDEARSDSDA